MCLGIPGQVIELSTEHEDLAVVSVENVKRLINIGLLDDGEIGPGDWILVHLGFALSLIDEATAKASLDFVTGHSDALTRMT